MLPSLPGMCGGGSGFGSRTGFGCLGGRGGFGSAVSARVICGGT